MTKALEPPRSYTFPLAVTRCPAKGISFSFCPADGVVVGDGPIDRAIVGQDDERRTCFRAGRGALRADRLLQTLGECASRVQHETLHRDGLAFVGERCERHNGQQTGKQESQCFTEIHFGLRGEWRHATRLRGGNNRTNILAAILLPHVLACALGRMSGRSLRDSAQGRLFTSPEERLRSG